MIIDDFNVDQLTQVTAAAPASANTDEAAGLGTNRNISVDKTAGASGLVNAAIAEVSGGILGMANGPATDSTMIVTWTGIANVDLTEAATATGIFMAFPNPIDNDLTVTFTINGTSTSTKVFLNGTFGPAFFFPFADFTDPGVFTSVTTVALEFNGGAAWDAQIDLVETRPTPPTVPVPAPLFLIGAGLVGLAASRKKSA